VPPPLPELKPEAVAAAVVPQIEIAPIATEPIAAAPDPVVEHIPQIETAAVATEREPVAKSVATEPEPVAVKPEPVAEPVAHVEAAPVASEPEPVAVEPESVPEPVAHVAAAPVAAKLEPVVEPVAHVESAPVATEPEPVAVEPVAQIEAAPVAPESEPAPVEPEPEPVLVSHVEAAPIAAEPEPVAVEPEPVVEHAHVDAAPVAAEPEPIADPVAHVEAALVAAEPELVEHPQIEAVHVATESAAEPVAHAAAPIASEPEPLALELEPVAEPVALLEAASVATAPEPEAERVTPVSADPEPVAETKPEQLAERTGEPQPEPEPVAVAAGAVEPPPVADHKPAAQEPAPIKLHEVPDPLFALAVEIRAVQAARAAALAAPQESSGLLELSEAVGTQSAALEEAKPAEHAAPVASPAAPSAPQPNHVTETAVAAVEASTAVALLVPPEPEKTLLLEPVALAPVAQPVVEPEPAPQSHPEALAAQPLLEPDGPTLPYAPMQDYRPATSRSIMPVPPRQQILSADSGPRITLPGPTLPPELTRLQDANVVTVIGEQTAQRTKEAIPPKGGSAPGWLVSALVMIVLLAAGLAVVYFLLLPRTVADAKPAPTVAPAATGPAPTGGNSPLAKFVEVTGFRIVTNSGDAAKKSEVQYLVVNHSDADISDANVFITLRSAKPGQAPLCRFSFKIPSLGPFEAKEMSSPIEKSARGVSLPDWQDVRADVQISQ
jgi:hypothetical protein